jgi:hypothetical protein
MGWGVRYCRVYQLIQKRILDVLPFSVLLQQIIEGLDGQGVQSGLILDCEHLQGSPTVGIYSDKHRFKRPRIAGTWSRGLWLAAHALRPA